MTAHDEAYDLGPKYPEIKVEDFGSDGNAFALVNSVTRALRRGGVSREEAEKFTKEAFSGDYDHVIQTCMEWVNC